MNRTNCHSGRFLPCFTFSLINRATIDCRLDNFRDRIEITLDKREIGALMVNPSIRKQKSQKIAHLGAFHRYKEGHIDIVFMSDKSSLNLISASKKIDAIIGNAKGFGAIAPPFDRIMDFNKLSNGGGKMGFSHDVCSAVYTVFGSNFIKNKVGAVAVSKRGVVAVKREEVI